MARDGKEARVKRWSAMRKTEVVLRLLRGEEVVEEEVRPATDYDQRKGGSGVSSAGAERWCRA